MNYFEKLPSNYKKSCKKTREYKPPQDKVDEFREYIKNSRLFFVGSGRSENVAEISALFSLSNNFEKVYCSSDATYPHTYKDGDIIIAYSGSGETVRTNNIIKTALGKDVKIVGFTANPNSSLAEMVEKSEGILFELPAKHKESKTYDTRKISGNHAPLALEGTESELMSLSASMDIIGSRFEDVPVEQYHDELWDLITEYSPVPKDFENVYKLIPSTKSNNKTIVIGEGFSGKIGKFFTTRFSHCAKNSEERRAYFYDDKGLNSATKGDLVLVISGSGTDLPYYMGKKAKKLGAKVASITSFDKSPLGKLSDAKIVVSGRFGKKPKGNVYHVQKNPKNSLFELRTIIALENFVYSIVEIENIPEKDIKDKHSGFT